MTLIASSILAAKACTISEAVVIAEKSGADWIHLDIMDGHFVPNLTYGPPVVRMFRPLSKLPFDAHLMVTNPDLLIPELIEIGVEYITVHQETCIHLHRTLSLIRDGKVKAGVALNPATSVETIIEMIHMLDLIIIMGVNPGFAGQKHIPETAAKVARLSEISRSREWRGSIMVDGGVTTENAGSLVLAGADILVAGASAFRQRKKKEAGCDLGYADQVKRNIEDLRFACEVAIEQGLDLTEPRI